MSKVKVGIVGATGLAGEGILSILINHPKVEITCLTSDRLDGTCISEALPVFKDKIALKLSKTDANELSDKCDLVFMTKKDPESMKLVKPLLDNEIKVIDIGGEFRLKNADEYEQWYKHEHLAKDLLKEAVYGLPEWNRDSIKDAKLIANPGCYPTGSVLSLSPLIKDKLIDKDSIAIVSYSGISGAGRSYSAAGRNLFVDCNENVRAYAVAKHKHTPEIEQGLSTFGEAEVKVSFIPHLCPMDRGIFTTITALPSDGVTTKDLISSMKKKYESEKFVRVFDEPSQIEIHQISHTNYCDISALVDERTGKALIFAAVDNLTKGASSQAIQNMNIMFGFDEDTAIAGKV